LEKTKVRKNKQAGTMMTMGETPNIHPDTFELPTEHDATTIA
jgi:hypothetical protein